MAKSRVEIGITRALLVLSLLCALFVAPSFVSSLSTGSHVKDIIAFVIAFVVVMLLGVAVTYMVVWVVRGFQKKD